MREACFDFASRRNSETVLRINIGIHSSSVSADDLKPSTCAALHLINVVGGGGTITGTAHNDLILGSSGKDTIDGLGGNDCIVGAGGDDIINGNDGKDICIGGGGNDTFLNCETTIP